MTQIAPITFATRFRGFLPVVVDGARPAH